MNAVYRATRFAEFSAAWFAVFFAVCLALIACGNKGELYLETIELSDEQKAILDSADAKEDPNKLKKKPKKKKTDGTQITQ